MSRGFSSSVLLTVVLATSAGCVATSSANPDGAFPTSIPTTTGAARELPRVLEARFLPNEPLLGSVSSIRGTAAFQTDPVDTARIAVYIRCVGAGSVEVDIEDTVTFTQPCVGVDADHRGTRNAVELYGTGPHTITGSAEGSAIWAVAVTEIPPR